MRTVWNIGVPCSNDTKKKISETKKALYANKIIETWNKGKKMNKEYGKVRGESNRRAYAEGRKCTIGELNSFYGKHHTEETKQLMSIAKRR